MLYCTRWPRKQTAVFMGEMKDGKGQVKHREVANASVLEPQRVTHPGGQVLAAPAFLQP